MNPPIAHRCFTAYMMLVSCFAFFACPAMVAAQTNISVAPLKMNVLYVGVDNPVSVAAAGSPDDRVMVTITGGGGVVTKINTGAYNVRVTNPTDDCVMNVYVDGKLAGSSNFRVRLMPEPVASVGGRRSGAYIAGDFFKSQAGVAALIENFPFQTKYEIVSFTVVLADEKGNLLSFNCQGSAFSDKAKEYFRQHILKPGDIVTIEQIMAKAENGKEFKLPSLLYNIK